MSANNTPARQIVPFTDDDLAQMKRELNRKIENIAVWAPALQALITRLDAAEKVIEKAGDCHRCRGCYCDEYLFWRNTACKYQIKKAENPEPRYISEDDI